MDDKWFKMQQKRVGVTADDIAKRAGRARSNVSHILTGKQRMSLEWARAFADVLQVPLATVLEKAGAADPPVARQLRPGFAESDAIAWQPNDEPAKSDAAQILRVAMNLGGDRPGVDVWRVKSRSMILGGLLEGDFVLVDTHQSERVKAGDTVLAQIYDNNAATAMTLIRRYEPPVLVAASCDPADARVHVVDGNNVVIRGKIVAVWRV